VIYSTKIRQKTLLEMVFIKEYIKVILITLIKKMSILRGYILVYRLISTLKNNLMA